jgi:hypothetical protein
MEATKHLIHWCTLCWFKQQNTSFIDALFVLKSTKSVSINEVFYCFPQQRVHQWMTRFVASINKECINEWGILLLPSTKSASINEVICCLHQQRVHQWMTWFVASLNECINECGVLLPLSTKSASINEVFHYLHQQRMHQKMRLLGDKSPHLLMHSLLMEAKNHIIHWCTLWWGRQ